jgi:hypothetical protein
MPTFDITDKCIKFVAQTIKDMPGNPGQEVLVERLINEAYGLVTVDVDFNAVTEEVSINASGEINWKSEHPEAIEIIIGTAEDNTELITAQAEIPGPWSLADAIASGNWKIVGWDSEWNLKV